MVKNVDYDIISVSYIGKPINNTVMYITKKVEHLLSNLYDAEDCLVYCENTIDIPDELLNKHMFMKTDNPKLEYALFTNRLAYQLETLKIGRKYTFTEGGYYIGENVSIGKNSIIEPLCFIDHDVVIGENARLLSGTKIRNSIIGNNFIANENSVIGSYGFTIAKDDDGNNVRIPTLGKVIIGDHVEIGMLANISVGSGGNTVIDNYVKIDAFVHIAHDVLINNNVEIPAGVIVGGFDVIEENVFIGINSTLRNRIRIGKNSMIGMGSVVTKDIPSNITVMGNPARPFDKNRS